jgi:hypothetical protein
LNLVSRRNTLDLTLVDVLLGNGFKRNRVELALDVARGRGARGSTVTMNTQLSVVRWDGSAFFPTTQTLAFA